MHHPYESFRASFEAFAQAAARDPDVIAIKTTVYRTSDESALVSSLIECAEEGKQSVCLVELKARFDERRNIEWSRAMEQAGVHVVHGFADLKIHAKMTLDRPARGGRAPPVRPHRHGELQRRPPRGSTRTSGCSPPTRTIAADVADLFNYVTGFGRPQRFRKLIVAPFTMRSRLVEEIRRVSTAAEEGEHDADPAEDERARRPDDRRGALRRGRRPASRSRSSPARSACSGPGSRASRETIRVRSIVGRFLEHSRIYSFEAGDTASVYFGSADLMPRNLDRRIEVLAPVEGARARGEVNAILDSAFSDTTNAWELGPDGVWTRVARQGEERALPPGGDDAPRPAPRSTRAELTAGASPISSGRPTRRPGSTPCSSPSSTSGRTRSGSWSPTSAADEAPAPVVSDRTYLGLGAEIARSGSLSPETVEAAARVCGQFAERARSTGAENALVIVTAPGRQGGDPDALVSALRARTRLPVRVLTAEDEGWLAYEGALARAVEPLPDSVGVVDVGGGSTEVVVGNRAIGALWVDSVDLGSLRLTRLALEGDPPSKRELAEARDLVRRTLAPLSPPRPDAALAVGGSARALAKLLGRTFDADDAEAGDRDPRPPPVVEGGAGCRHRRAARRNGAGGALLLAETVAPPRPAVHGRPRRPPRGRGTRARARGRALGRRSVNRRLRFAPGLAGK